MFNNLQTSNYFEKSEDTNSNLNKEQIFLKTPHYYK